jgi:hypothetical protein
VIVNGAEIVGWVSAVLLLTTGRQGFTQWKTRATYGVGTALNQRGKRIE